SSTLGFACNSFISELTNLRELRGSFAPVSDGCFKYFSRLSKLETLSIRPVTGLIGRVSSLLRRLKYLKHPSETGANEPRSSRRFVSSEMNELHAKPRVEL